MLREPAAPIAEDKDYLNAEISASLMAAVRRAAARKKIKIRQIVEHGMRLYLVRECPEEAVKIGLGG